MRLRHVTIAAALALIALLPAKFVAAQKYPARTVKIVVAYPPGGTSDLLARLLAAKLTDEWSVPVVVENRPGASGNIGTEIVAKARPDGYTLAMTNSVVAINAGLFPNLPFDVERDFEPLGLIGSTPMVLSTYPGVSAKSLAELTSYAKANAGKLAFGSCGVGTPQHLAVEMYKSMAGIDLLHVPFSGCAPAVTDTIGGQVQILVTTAFQSAPYIARGDLRGMAVTTKRRSDVLPDVPTFEEAGFAGYALDIWFGLMAPSNTPQPILEKIHVDVKRTVKAPDVAGRMRAAGVEELITTREQHATILKDDVRKYSAIIRKLNLIAQR